MLSVRSVTVALRRRRANGKMKRWVPRHNAWVHTAHKIRRRCIVAGLTFIGAKRGNRQGPHRLGGGRVVLRNSNIGIVLHVGHVLHVVLRSRRVNHPVSKDLLQMRELELCPLKIRLVAITSLTKVVHALAQTASPGVLLCYSHRVTVELRRQVRPESQAFRERQQASAEIMDDARCKILLLRPVELHCVHCVVVVVVVVLCRGGEEKRRKAGVSGRIFDRNEMGDR